MDTACSSRANKSRRILHRAFICLIACFVLSIKAQAQDAYNNGVSLYSSKKYAEALALFETGQIASSQAANAAYYRALCYHQLGKIKEAAAAYRYVFSKYPNSPAAINSIKTLAKLDPKAAAESLKTVDIIKTGPLDWKELPEKVAVPFIKRRSHLYVNAEINGVAVPMIFDTGASTTTCTESFVTQNGISVKRTQYRGRAMGVGGEVSTSLAMVDLKVGPLKRRLPLYIQDDRGMPATEQLPLLGQTFFGDMPYMIDDNQGVIVFSKPVEQESAVSGPGKLKAQQQRLAENEAPFRRDRGNIVIMVKVNGRECEMYFDTGAASVAFADRHLAQCGLNRPIDAFQGQGGGVGGKREAFGFSIDSIKVANVEKRNVKASVLINANFDRPLLGQTFLSGMRYTIDPAKKVIRFE